ncbi:hypothetical protein HAV15_012699 [Penicillium sp. str. |nr:hypothetical protein HAV15_012699 [Penicillium sp. str. \
MDSSGQAAPSTHHPTGVYRRCGPVSKYYNQQTSDWDTYNVGDWINDWWNNNSGLISGSSSGFAGAFGQWAMGNPTGPVGTMALIQTGSAAVLITALNDRGDDIRSTYYVLESVNRLHTYFTGIGEAFTTTALGAALSKDSWATTFYKDKDDKSVTALKDVLGLVTTVIGVGASFAGLGPAVAGAVAGAGGALISGGMNAATNVLPDHQDDTFEKSADLGGILGSIVVDSLKTFTTANNQLMSVTDAMTNMLVGTAINQLYRTQKIFIMGGGSCDDSQGIGSGPEATVCRDGQAWYLYYWQENDVVSTTSHQWGWVASPPGADQLGKGVYGGVSVQVGQIQEARFRYIVPIYFRILSTPPLMPGEVAGYNYDSDTAAYRASDAITNAWASPGSKGASWEGIFTIPVCDVTSAIESDYQGKEYILQPYGHDSRPVWCGAICSSDSQKTSDFINAAHMDGFKSPKHLCDSDPGY